MPLKAKRGGRAFRTQPIADLRHKYWTQHSALLTTLQRDLIGERDNSRPWRSVTVELGKKRHAGVATRSSGRLTPEGLLPSAHQPADILGRTQ
ncbi:hypothetical protein J6590_001614 [Homalodisca vitripennis]|nr:hypothetical protein J6590_001614 [Homalodisca vitripennis]